MIATPIYSLSYSAEYNPESLSKSTWLVILHASRIPPHVGLMVNGNYNSLTIKEREMNISLEALLKTINQKKIESLFVKIETHPVFSSDYQLQVFQEQLKQFTAVKQGEATCLSPIKLFFEEFYAVKNDGKLLFEFVDTLKDNDYITETIGINIKEPGKNNIFTFTCYSVEELQERIKQERDINIKH